MPTYHTSEKAVFHCQSVNFSGIIVLQNYSLTAFFSALPALSYTGIMCGFRAVAVRSRTFRPRCRPGLPHWTSDAHFAFADFYRVSEFVRRTTPVSRDRCSWPARAVPCTRLLPECASLPWLFYQASGSSGT